MAGNTSFDALISTTLKKYRPQLTDNIFVELPLLYWLKESGKIRQVDGGEQIVEPLLYAQNTTAASYAGYDSIDITPQEGITAAVYDWKQFAVTVAISGIEEAKNSGETAVINLLKSKIEQAEMSAADKLNEQLHGLGTGNGSKDFAGLQQYIPTDPTTGTVGGINRATAGNEFWRPSVNTAGADTALTIPDMSTRYNNVSRGGGKDHPDWILTTQALWEKYEALLQPALRYADAKTADAGFQNLLYRSTPVVWDSDCTAGWMYFLNSKYINLVVHSKKWFKPTEFQTPIGQDAKYSHLYSYGNLTCRNFARQGALQDKIA